MMKRRGLRIAPFLILLFGFFQFTSVHAGVLEDVKKRGLVRCAVMKFTPFGSSPAVQQAWQGFNRDLCRAVAAAVLGDAEAIEILPRNGDEKETPQAQADLQTLGAQQSGLLSGSQTQLRPTAMAFAHTQSVVLRESLPISSLADLDGKFVCVPEGDEARALERRAQRDGIDLRLIAGDDAYALRVSVAGFCAALSALGLNAASILDLMPDSPENWVFLPDVLDINPLGPLVPAGDPQWQDIVSWAVYALITAEERKISSGNVEALAADSRDPRIRRVLGLEEDLGGQVGLDRRWAYQIIKQVGNYAEVYDRHFGAGSPLKLPRGANALWLDGGLLQAPAFQ